MASYGNDYQTADGWNNSAGLAVVRNLPAGVYEPRVTETEYGRYLTALDLTRVADGYRVTTWDYGDYLTAAKAAEVLTDLFLLSGGTLRESRQITMRTRDVDRTFAAFNVVVHRPRLRYVNGKYQGFAVTVYIVGAAS